MKRKIALGILTVAVLVGSGFCIYATEKSPRVNDNEALVSLEDAYDSNRSTTATYYATYSSAITNRQILEELKAMNKTLTEINKKLK